MDIYGQTQTENGFICSEPLTFDVTRVGSCLGWGAAVTAKIVKMAKLAITKKMAKFKKCI